MFFIIYMNDLPSCVSNTQPLLFVDDTKCFCNVSHPSDVTMLLGIIISSWDNHCKYIIPKSYKMLGLLRRYFSKFHSPAVKKTLYLSLVRSQITYCSVIWRPYLIEDIVNFERIQRRATKFIIILILD